MKIYKYELDWFVGEQDILVHQPAELIHCEVQFEKPCLWFIVDLTTSQINKHFCKVGTGCEFNNEGLEYINSLQYMGGKHVIHIFEVIK